MTKQELTVKLTDLQQKRLTLAAKLDQMTLQLRPLDELISLLQRMLITLQTQDEQKEELAKLLGV